jgi:hypothetical protein
MLTEGTMRQRSTRNGLVMKNRSGGELEHGCGTSRAPRSEACAENSTGGGQGSSWVLNIGWGRLAGRSWASMPIVGEWSL